MVPRNHANKNTPHKNSDFTLFSAIKSIENTTKTLFKYREGSRTKCSIKADNMKKNKQ